MTEVIRYKHGVRYRLFEIVEKAHGSDTASRVYDIAVVLIALISLLPLMVKEAEWNMAIRALDLVTVYILFFDYILRWVTNDFRRGEEGSVKAFIRYPFGLNAIIDLLAILPSLGLIPATFKFLRVLRVVKILRYSKSLTLVANVFSAQRNTLLSVLFIALGYIFISALAMFTYEPETFDHFFEALYWATTALTTVGYGDVYPVSDVGRLISMVSSLFGIAVIALPAGIVTGGFMEELQKSSAHPEKYFEDSEKTVDILKGVTVSPQMYWRGHPRVRHYATGMLFCCVLNVVLFEASLAFGLPLWLDTTGTALAGFALGPVPGVLVALINNLYLSVVHYGTSSLVYFVTSSMVALVFGCLLTPLKDGIKGNAGRIAVAAVIVTLGIAAVDTVIVFWLQGGMATNIDEALLVSALESAGAVDVVAVFLGLLVVRVLDSAVVALIVMLIWRICPRTWKRFHYVYGKGTIDD